MKQYQIVCHKTGLRSPLLQGDSLTSIAERAEQAVKGADNASLDDFILVLCDELTSGDLVISRQPLMRISTILELVRNGHKEPACTFSATDSEVI